MTNSERRTGFPVGETTFTEQVTRTIYPDGTMSDSEPIRKLGGPMSPVIAGLRGIALSEARRRGMTVIRLERTVTVTAGEWVEVAKSVEATDAPVEQVSPDGYCRRMLCGHGRRHHGLNPSLTGGSPVNTGPCSICDNDVKCQSFVGNETEGEEG